MKTMSIYIIIYTWLRIFIHPYPAQMIILKYPYPNNRTSMPDPNIRTSMSGPETVLIWPSSSTHLILINTQWFYRLSSSTFSKVVASPSAWSLSSPVASVALLSLVTASTSWSLSVRSLIERIGTYIFINLYLCLCIYIYIYIYICVFAYIHIHIYTKKYRYKNVLQACILYIYIYIYMHIYMYYRRLMRGAIRVIHCRGCVSSHCAVDCMVDGAKGAPPATPPMGFFWRTTRWQSLLLHSS
jgi:hypothetical protein